MLRINKKEFFALYQEALIVFRQNHILFNQICSLKKIIDKICGKNLIHNIDLGYTLGIRSLAQLISIAMLKHLVDEDYETVICGFKHMPENHLPIGMPSQAKIGRLIEVPGYEIVIKWCKFFSIPLSPDLDLNQLNLTNWD